MADPFAKMINIYNMIQYLNEATVIQSNIYTLNEANQWPPNRKYQTIGRCTSNIVLLDISLFNHPLIQTKCAHYLFGNVKRFELYHFLLSVNESLIKIMQID